MSKKLTAQIRIAAPPELRARLEKEALRQRRSLSSLIRVLLERALFASEKSPDPIRSEYQIKLNSEEVARLERRGYGLSTDE